MINSIPESLRPLYAAAAPALRFRILRDLADMDESYLDMLDLRREVERTEEPQAIIAARDDGGTWGSSPISTENAMLRLCELGLERIRVVDDTLQRALLPSLGRLDSTGGLPPRLARDTLLRMITRASSEPNPLVTVALETVLTEWEMFLSRTESGSQWPTFPAYAALCWHPWDDEEIERVSEVVQRVLKHLEEHNSEDAHALRLYDKSYYLSHPEQLLYELELSARLGITHSCSATRWMFDEVESRQDSDGWVRFDMEDFVLRAGIQERVLPWYFPLGSEKTPDLDWTFRTALIFKLLEYDF